MRTVPLAKQDSITFTSNIEGGYSPFYGYIYRDTMPSYWFLFAPKEFLDNTTEILPQEQIRLYPNPTTGQVLIENKSNKKIASVALINAYGQVVRLFREEDEVDLGGQPPGIYFLRIQTADGYFLTKRVVKR